jgi:hypothetical protein
MGELDLPTGVRQADLTIVHVAREDEVERVRTQAVEHRGEVGEQDPQVGLLGEVGLVIARARIVPGDPDAAAAQLEHPALVGEEHGRLQLA